MSDPTRERIVATFDRELEASPMPPGLRTRAVSRAVAAPRRQKSVRPQLFAVVAAILAVAIVTTLAIGGQLFRSNAVPAKPSAPPPARVMAAFAYDDVTHQFVLFGGRVGDAAGGKVVAETWAYDGKTWALQHTTTSPTARFQAVMVYDSARHDLVLFGGMQATTVTGKGGSQSFAPVRDTWTWDGRSWTQHSTAHAPAFNAGSSPAAAFDPATGMVLFFGWPAIGTGQAGPAETWGWNGSDWTQLRPATTPQIVDATMVYDGARLLLIGTGGLLNGRYVDSTWAWTGADWTLLTPKVELPPGAWLGAAYDPERHQVVVLDVDTWTWDGSTWSRQHVTTGPAGIGYLVYDAALREVLSWSDQVQATGDSDLWAWTGSDWKLVQAGAQHAAPPHPADYLGVMTPAAAEVAVRNTEKDASPVLLPTSLPAGMDAVVSAASDHFSIQYRSDDRSQEIDFSLDFANPPPGGPNSSDTYVKFRNALALKYRTAGDADYFVYDTTAPMSQRWLMWLEPGTSSQTNGTGVPYFLSAIGLTDQEFWQVANSLR